MSKTADFLQGIWSDPWFLALAPDAKLVYVWGFTNQHGNMAGLFVVGRTLIEAETGVRGRRLAAALEAIAPKLLYDEDTGALWVVGRAKRVRNKTVQIAKSIAHAVRDCPHPPFQLAFLERYGDHAWLSPALGEVGLNLTELPAKFTANGSGKPTAVNFTGTSPEVPSQSPGQSQQSPSSEQPPPSIPPPAGGEATQRLSAIKEALKGTLDDLAFHQWIEPLEAEGFDGTLWLRAPNHWFRERFEPLVRQTADCPVQVAETGPEREKRERTEASETRRQRRAGRGAR